MCAVYGPRAFLALYGHAACVMRVCSSVPMELVHLDFLIHRLLSHCFNKKCHSDNPILSSTFSKLQSNLIVFTRVISIRATLLSIPCCSLANIYRAGIASPRAFCHTLPRRKKNTKTAPLSSRLPPPASFFRFSSLRKDTILPPGLLCKRKSQGQAAVSSHR